jgi:hypothetical protein
MASYTHDKHYQTLKFSSHVHMISYSYIVNDIVFDIDNIVHDNIEHDIVYDGLSDV